MSAGTSCHPPYQLRPNKAIDRFLLVDLLRHLPIEERKKYEYIGMGGPFLEDFKILHHYYPEVKLTSIESNLHTFKRQKFNRSFKDVKIVRQEITNYFEGIDEFKRPLVVWFDGTNFGTDTIKIIHTILRKLTLNSIFKVTARISFDMEPGFERFASEASKAIEEYLETNSLLPHEKQQGIKNDICSILSNLAKQQDETIRVMQSIPDFLPEGYEQLLDDLPSRAKLYFQVIQNVVESVYPRTGNIIFHFLSSHYYSDGTPMISITGILIRRQEIQKIKNRFHCFKVQGDQLDGPTVIDAPILSVKERMKLDPYLPICIKGDTGMQPRKTIGSRLREKLGYLIDDSRKRTEAKLEFYNYYHQYYPFFSRIQL